MTWLKLQPARMAAIQPQQHVRDARFWQERYAAAVARHLEAIRELLHAREQLGDEAGVIALQQLLSEPVP